MDWPFRFLALIASIPPHAWGAIHVRGRIHERLVDRVGEVAGFLPHPLPHESVIGARLLQGLATSTDGATLLEEVDHWCDTGWPRRWPAPTTARRWDEGMLFAGAALAAARLADAVEHSPGRHLALAAASERLARRAVAGPLE